MTRDISREIWAITGASGRIGTTLREGLLPLVAGLILIDTVEPADLKLGERAVIADLADPHELRHALQGTDGVIHLAAIPDEADFNDLVSVNVIGTWHLLEAARTAQVSRVVYASTGRTLGMYDAGDTVSSDSPVRPDGLYAVSKVAGEALCQLYVDKFGFTATCLRIGAFKSQPVEARDLSVWLSPADAVRAFIAAMTRDGDDFAVLLAYSNNAHSWADLSSGHALGYFPEDDASALFHTEPVAVGKQAGVMAEPAFTLDRQRPF
ncbi:NAD(P)-dependent oxidoreductase [Glaciihabitans sp. dw_435]|uniref:NAD-dependent epimerase/dehydratase family protein n=1 Tax=Glaciihabitans sp. dw_435 TaxID=2720081 RepID=UPI001BD219E1|nr:NAD(P)-dependent oxidoreductase [Glaciihabitans sp. dw_435]